MPGKRKKPSRTRRHRESVAAKRRARAFYRMRSGYEEAAALLPPDEAEAMRPWRGCGFALLAFLAAAALGCCAAWFAFK